MAMMFQVEVFRVTPYFPWGKVAGEWGWPFTSIQRRS